MSYLGTQIDGNSPDFTKSMALEALERSGILGNLPRVADIGGGCGELTKLLSPRCDEIWLVDYSPPSAKELPTNVNLIQRDLNRPWEIPDDTFNFVFSLECIEHVENPRHFMRELSRITKPDGYLFVSTPNNHSLTSKLTFLLRGKHRLFQEASYPAHITAILRCDFERMAEENNLQIISWIYSNCDTLPFINISLKIPGSLSSLSVGVLMQKRT